MSFSPKLLALDADGTILGPDEVVPPSIVEKLRQIDAQGIPIVLVTGRAWLSSRPVIDQLGIPHMYCVCNNGATVVSDPPMEVLKSETFDPSPIIEVIRDHSTMAMAVEVFGRGYDMSAPLIGGVYELHGELRVVPFEDLSTRRVSRIILRDAVVSPTEFADVIAKLDLRKLYHSKAGENWLDIGPEQAGKDKGLAFVASRLGVAQADVLAIGDGFNDVDMLTWAGRGVALAGAPEELVSVADDMTGPFPDGTLEELNRWFLLKRDSAIVSAVF